MHDDILTRQVRDIMAETFGIDESDLPESPSQATLARWTSLSHMVLLVSFEDHFGVTFSMDEMTSMTSFDSILATLRGKEASGQPA